MKSDNNEIGHVPVYKSPFLFTYIINPHIVTLSSKVLYCSVLLFVPDFMVIVWSVLNEYLDYLTHNIKPTIAKVYFHYPFIARHQLKTSLHIDIIVKFYRLSPQMI